MLILQRTELSSAGNDNRELSRRLAAFGVPYVAFDAFRVKRDSSKFRQSAGPWFFLFGRINNASHLPDALRATHILPYLDSAPLVSAELFPWSSRYLMDFEVRAFR